MKYSNVTGKWIVTGLLIFVLAFAAKNRSDEVSRFLTGTTIENPYEKIDWESVNHIHSMTHLHYGNNIEERKILYEMGFRHFMMTNYYPSKPTYPLPDDLHQKDDVTGAPNAEHHSVVDHGLHFNTPGSFYTTGYGLRLHPLPDAPVFVKTIHDLNLFDQNAFTPGEGVYRIDIRVQDRDQIAGPDHILLTIEGVEECEHSSFGRIGDGSIMNRRLPPDYNDTIYFRVTDHSVRIRLEFDPEKTEITQLRVMQGTNRPWREAFSEALNGKRVDQHGNPIEGLLHAEGGGITINHPMDETIDDYLNMLKFDERVLGIEIWNHRRLFGIEPEEPHMRYYNHWDDILSTGQRSYGFMVKDHRWRGQGRNILLVSDTTDRTKVQQQLDALKAYRNGQFYGLLGAIDVDGKGRVKNPYDFSEFRFERIELHREAPAYVEVEVAGNDPDLRSNIQLRFITDDGIAKITNGQNRVSFILPQNEDGTIDCKYVRIEAIAWPDTHNQGEPLTAEMVEAMNVYELIRIHDHRGGGIHGNDIDPGGSEPIPVIDMIFSQPIMFSD